MCQRLADLRVAGEGVSDGFDGFGPLAGTKAARSRMAFMIGSSDETSGGVFGTGTDSLASLSVPTGGSCAVPCHEPIDTIALHTTNSRQIRLITYSI